MFDELCSAELLDSKFLVPCDPVGYLNHQYGPMSLWSVPEPANYTWFNIHKYSEWSDDDWPFVVRFYDRYGYVERTRTINHLNKASKINITKLPKEDLDGMDYRD